MSMSNEFRCLVEMCGKTIVNKEIVIIGKKSCDLMISNISYIAIGWTKIPICIW